MPVSFLVWLPWKRKIYWDAIWKKNDDEGWVYVCFLSRRRTTETNRKKNREKTWFFRFRFPDGHPHLLRVGEEEQEATITTEATFTLISTRWTNTNNNDVTTSIVIIVAFFSSSFHFFPFVYLLLLLGYNGTSLPAGTLALRLVKLYDKSSISHLGASFPMCIHAQRDENITTQTKKDT